MAALAATPSTVAPPRPYFFRHLLPGAPPRRPPPPFPRYAASASSRSRAPRPRPAPGRRGAMREFFEAAREMAPDGGPPRWFAPLDPGGGGQGGRVPGAPALLYLPGIDGVGLGLIRHHERLSKMFEMWCLHIPVEDRTPFERLVEYVERTVQSERSRAPDRPVYLVGESVGACIALAVAARNRDIDLGHLSISHGCTLSQHS